MATLDRKRYLDANEAAHLLQFARGSVARESERDYVALSVTLNGALRLREVRALNTTDLKRDETGAPILDVWFSKGKASRRVRITEEMAELLEDWIRKQRRRLGGADGPMFTVFYRGLERRIARRSLEHVFKRIARRAGLPGCYSFHSLRHTYGVYYYRSTRDILALREQLGHARVSTTQIYTSIDGATARENLRSLPAALKPPGRYRRARGNGMGGNGEERRRASGSPL